MWKWVELNEQTPLWDDVAGAFDLVRETAYVDRLTLRQKVKANK